MFMTIIFFIIGLLLVVVGADYFIAGSSLIAKRFGIPKLIVGLTVVAIGTSAPELAINIISSLGGHNDLALGNILGSNISNIFLIFAVASLFVSKVTISRNSLKQVVVAFAVSIAITLTAYIGLGGGMRIAPLEGIILFSLGLVYWLYLYKITKANDERLEDDNIDENKLRSIKSLWLVVVITVAGLGALLYGSSLVTESAVLIAKVLGISELIISGTIIAIGTSLPELVTSIQAVRQKQFDLMIGNVVGSNIVNTLFILSTSAIISPIFIQGNISLFFLTANVTASLLLLLGFILFGNRVFKRWQGLLFLVLYIIFLIYSFI
jgi:cation:H+ antiporter